MAKLEGLRHNRYLWPWRFGTLALCIACWTCATLDAGGSGDGSLTNDGDQPSNGSSTSDANSIGFSAESNAIRILGRVGPLGVMSWPNSGFELSFTGTGAEFDFQAKNGNSVVTMEVDGNQTLIQTITSAGKLTTGLLTNGNHVVRVLKISEPRLGEVRLTSYSFSGRPAQALPSPRRVEVIGDSISLGYGVVGQMPCNNNFLLENSSLAFGAVAAKGLHADVSIVAWAGKGVLRNDTSDMSTTPVTMSNLWTRAVASDSTSLYDFNQSIAPQAVVIALGTNDFDYAAVDGQGQVTPLRPTLDNNAFVVAYTELVEDVMTRYPTAQLILTNSPMLFDGSPTSTDQQHMNLGQNLNSVLSQVNSAAVSVLDLPNLATTQMSGCGNHPSVSGQQALAELLSSKMKALLGW